MGRADLILLFLFSLIRKHRARFARKSKTTPRTCQLAWHVLQEVIGKTRGRNWERGATFFVGVFPQWLSAQEPPRRAFVVLMDPKGCQNCKNVYSLAKSNRNPGVWKYFVQYSDLSFGDFRRGIGVAPRHLSAIRAKASP